MNTKIYDKIPCGGFHIGNGLTIHKEDNKEILSSVDVVVGLERNEDGESILTFAEGDYTTILNKMFKNKPIEFRGILRGFDDESNSVIFDNLVFLGWKYSVDTKQILFGCSLVMTSQIFEIVLNPDNTWEVME